MSSVNFLDKLLDGAEVEWKVLDLQASHPGIKGFSRTSLFAMRQFYAFFSPQCEVVPQPVGQLPWGHVRTLLDKVKSVELVVLYARACIEQARIVAILMSMTATCCWISP